MPNLVPGLEPAKSSFKPTANKMMQEVNKIFVGKKASYLANSKETMVKLQNIATPPNLGIPWSCSFRWLCKSSYKCLSLATNMIDGIAIKETMEDKTMTTK